jgi:hypothetical protein
MDVEKHIEFLLQNQAAHDAKIGVLLDMQAKNERMLAEVVSSINSLARIAQACENRIERLDDVQ